MAAHRPPLAQTLPMPTPPLTIDARREATGWLRSLARFTGLAALTAAIARGPLWRTRHNRTTTGGVLLGLAAAVAMVALLIPSARAPIAGVLRAPGGIVQVLGGGSASDSADKSYPRIYSVKLNIDLPIKSGSGLIHVPVQPIAYQYPNTAPVGKPGNTYLYAHDRPGMFLGLHKAAVGDVIVVELSPAEKLYYQVTEIHGNVPWNDLEWLRPSGDDRLTLQTCNFSGDYDPRFIVVLKQVPPAQGQALAPTA